MEEITTRGPKPNEFAIPKHHAYASTYMKAAEIAEFLLTKLEPINVETLDANDRKCSICQDEFHMSEDVKLAHAPVKMVCGHIFGGKCIKKWLDPLCYWLLPEFGLRSPSETIDDMGKHVKTSCPICRRVFFPKVYLEPMELLAARLFFWDFAYVQAGVARSAKEAHTRKYLWKYVKYSHSVNEIRIAGDIERALLKEAQWFLFEFATRLKRQALTPIQERLREKLLMLAECDPRRIDPMFNLGADGSLISRAIALEGEFEWVLRSTDATTIAHGEEKDNVKDAEVGEDNQSEEATS